MFRGRSDGETAAIVVGEELLSAIRPVEVQGVPIFCSPQLILKTHCMVADKTRQAVSRTAPETQTEGDEMLRPPLSSQLVDLAHMSSLARFLYQP